MKKNLLIHLFLAISTCFTYAYEVPTGKLKKNILLEEFTGIHCGYCPQGHKIANTLNTAQTGVAYIVAVHSGNFAEPFGTEPDYRIDEGETLDKDLGISSAGYPSGAINRHVFEGSSVIRNRNSWIKDAKQIHLEEAPVNLWIKSEYDGNTRMLKIHVEGYYTAESQPKGQFLNVLWTQSNIQGPQNGGGVGADYIHQHMLRGYVTPMWGEELDKPEEGMYFQKDFSYQLPENVKNIPVKAEDVEIIAFVTAGHKEVLNVTGSKAIYSNYDKPLGATISAPKLPIGTRYGFNLFETVLKNDSDKPITTAGFEIEINGDKQSIVWNGTIPPFVALPVTLNVDPYVINENNKYKITLISVNGQSIRVGSLQGDFAAPLAATPTINVTIQTDLYADENRYFIKDAEGDIIKELGPYQTDKKAIYKETVELEPGNVYSLEIQDAWGDGMQQPKGYLKIHTVGNELIDQNYDIQAFGYRSFFRTSLTPSAIVENHADYKYMLDLQGKKISVADATVPYIITLYSMEGKCLSQCENTFMPIGTIPAGFYLLSIVRDGKEVVSKISIH